nr:hypothetical protein [Tanacetum cinerariifolium]
MKEKLKKYFERMPPVITCAATLNPCFNVHGVELLTETISKDLKFFDDSHATKAKKWFNDSLEGFFNIYYANYGNPTTESRSRVFHRGLGLLSAFESSVHKNGEINGNSGATGNESSDGSESEEDE